MTNKTKKDWEEGQSKATFDELCDQALTHYEQISSETGHWNSLIPKAIECYRTHRKTIKKEVKKALKKAKHDHEILVNTILEEKEKEKEEIWETVIDIIEAFEDGDTGVALIDDILGEIEEAKKELEGE